MPATTLQPTGSSNGLLLSSLGRVGFGSMGLTGSGCWGPPHNKEDLVHLLQMLPGVGVNFIDTADSYGPHVSEDLICEALHPYSGITVATKGGLVRTGPNKWHPLGRPEYLRQQILLSCRRLRIDRLHLWQLHRIDPLVPRDEQFGALKCFLDEGLVEHIGLCQVSEDELADARKILPISSVQNRYNILDRESEAILKVCEDNGMVFIAWSPLGAKAVVTEPLLAEIAAARGATPAQVALAWLLRRSRSMLPIPGTGSLRHLRENVKAQEIDLTDQEFELLNAGASLGLLSRGS